MANLRNLRRGTAGFEIRGIPEVEEQMVKDLEQRWDKVTKGAREEGTRILERVVARTPIKTGALRKSGRLIIDKRDSGGRFATSRHAASMQLAWSFGNSKVDYAIPVHEILYATHKIGQAKFLESVLNEEESSIVPNIARNM